GTGSAFLTPTLLMRLLKLRDDWSFAGKGAGSLRLWADRVLSPAKSAKKVAKKSAKKTDRMRLG
ncbi:MAG: hypothetical protein ACR2G5_15290, partial [Pyrinomonadaceae bacterium]